MSTLGARDLSAVWHPFTQAGRDEPVLPVARGKGSRLYLDNGRSLVDCISSWWCNLHGHSHPKIVAAIASQAATLDHVLFGGCTHEPAVTLAERLLPLVPGAPSKVFFSDNGSTAVEVAIKIALQFFRNRGEKRGKILALRNAYHGDTFGAMAVGERGIFSVPFSDHLFDVHFLPAIPSSESLEACEQWCKSGDVAAFIFEPGVQGAGGMQFFNLAGIDCYSRLCRQYGALIIADEVMTGFGRTGPLFASGGCQTLPDMVCLSKGLTGGTLPLAVTTCTEEIFAAFISKDHSKTFFHGHTYTANPIACAAAVASLELTLAPECSADRARIETLHQSAQKALASNRGLDRVRSRGTILAANVTGEARSGYGSLVSERGARFFAERGFLVRPLGDVVYLMPPYCVSDKELLECYAALAEFGESEARG
jgi:adenosylmethionine-8-amino-7-oxononanoate aminotransferase